jgi:hypothetical protein
MSLEKLRRTLARVRAMLPSCPGPAVVILEGTRQELDALPPLPADCSRCGRPLAEHADAIRFIEVVRPGGMGR